MKKEAQAFISEVPTMLQALKQSMAQSASYAVEELTYDYDTINKVEAYYLDVVDGKERSSLPADKLKNAFCAYLGEAVKHHLGGEWEIGKVKSDEAYGTPIILGWGKGDHPRIGPEIWEIILLRDREKGDIALRIQRAVAREKN